MPDLPSFGNPRPSSASSFALTPGPSYSEGSDSGSSPNKQYHRPTHFASQGSIIIEDDEDYEVMSDNEVEETNEPSLPYPAPEPKSPTFPLADDDLSFEGDADDEGGGAETDEDRVGRKLVMKPPETPSSPRDCDDYVPSTFARALSPLTPRRSHREQMRELSALFEKDGHKRKKYHGRTKSLESGSLAPLPNSLLKYIRKWSKEKSMESGENEDDSLGRDAGSDEGHDDAENDDDFSFDDSSTDWEYPAANEVDWVAMPLLPLQFYRYDESKMRQRTPHYLDASMLSSDLTFDDANRFAWEHAMLLHAVLQLLAERDQVGVEGSIDSADNIWKKGPLKKLSTRGGKSKLSAQWKVKYVELRHGNLCYYEDNGEGRKMIHLRHADADVKASPPNKNHLGFVFELSVLGASTSHWMANSEEERQAWIKSIQSAMLGSVAPRREVDLAPHQEAITVFNTLQGKIRASETKEQYCDAAAGVERADEAVRVPLEWILHQVDEKPQQTESQSMQKRAKTAALAQKELKSSIVDFWKKLDLLTFCLNGIKLPHDSPLASERLIGALTRIFLEFDKVVADEEMTIPELTELQAISYARNILLAVIRDREEMCALSAARFLLNNPNLVVVSPSDHEDIVSLEVSPAGEELPDDLPHFADEMTGWLWVRKLKQPPKSRKQRYAVMSGGVLSFYESAIPRPNGLRWQAVLIDAKLESDVDTTDGTDERYSLTVHTRKEDLVLSFDFEGDFLDWRECIEDQIEISEVPAGYDASLTDMSGALQVDDSYEPNIRSTNEFGASSALLDADNEGEIVEIPLELVKQEEPHATRKQTMLVSSASRLSRAAGKTAGKIADTAGKVAETAGKAAGKVAGTAGKAAGKVAGTAGKLTDEGIRIAKSTAAGSLRGGIRVAKGAISKTPGVNVVRGAVGRTVGRLRASRGASTDEMDGGNEGNLKKRPSMQMLLGNTALADKRDPTVQCVVQTCQTFHVVDREDAEVWLTVHAKLYRAFLLRGGPSGRMAQGDALIQFDIVEQQGEDMDDDSEVEGGLCALPSSLWRR